MSQAAYEHYQARAEMLDIPLPPILDGKPYDLLDGTGSEPLTGAVARFCDAMSPVEPFAIEGIPAVEKALGEPLSSIKWEVMKHVLPRASGALTVARYAGKHVTAFVDRALGDGADGVFMEAVERRRVPRPLFRHATNTRYYYDLDVYEPSQVCIAMHATGSSGNRIGRLVLVQGVYDKENYKGNEYITARYGGATLEPGDLRALQVAAV